MQANPSAAAMLNLRPRDLVGKPLRGQIWKGDRGVFQAHLAHLSTKRQSTPFEVRLQPHRRKGPLQASLLVRISPRPLDRGGSLLWFLSDRTVHRGAEQVFRDAADGILTLDSHLRVVLFNPAAEHIFCCPATEAVDQPVARFIPKGLAFPDRADMSRKDESSKEIQEQTRIVRVRGLRTDGVNFPLEASVARVGTEGNHVFVVVLRNMAERIGAEEIRQSREHLIRMRGAELKALTAKLLKVQEEERRRIARELHDDLSQRMAALAVEAERLAGVLPATLPSDVMDSLRTLHAQAGQIAEDVHGLAYELHPSILDDLGLNAALKAFAQDVSKRAGFPVAFASDQLPAIIPGAIANCLYRVAQECLRNVTKHARASQVTVKLVGSGNWIGLSVQDNGVGFDVDSSRSGKLGLMSMRERLQAVGGVLHVLTAVGKGTTIPAWVPSKGSH